MSSSGRTSSQGGVATAAAAATRARPPPPAPSNGQLHSRPFMLRFASDRELGRSMISPFKPGLLPPVVKDKFYSRAIVCDDEVEQRALAQVKEICERTPQKMYEDPKLSSHEYGWFWDKARPAKYPLRWHIKDSAWLKAEILRLQK